MLQSEKAPVADNNWTKSQLFMECVGTFILTYFCALSVMGVDTKLNTGLGNALAQFIVLFFIIYAGANVSGANYNGAVTIALMTSRHFGVKRGCLYLMAQFIGALAAALLLLIYKALYHGKHNKFPNNLGYPHCDVSQYNLFACFMMETLSTVFLITAVYWTAVNSSKPNNWSFAMCISGVLGLSCISIGNITGAGLNPWRVLPASILTGELFTAGYDYAWVYYLGYPFAGVFTGFMWRLLYIERKQEEAAEAEPEQDEENNKLNGKENTA